MSSYKKFVAGAATATLVASAIAPVAAAADSKNFTDVNDRYKDAVDYVVSKGVNGLSDTQFGVQQNIKRVDAAVFIAKALELDGANSPDSGFTDVPARAAKSVNALKEAKLINGKSATKFGSEDNLTRGEVSLILQKAYDLKGNANNVKFTDVSNRYLGAVAGMLDAKVTSGISETKFGTENPVKRGDLAIWLYKLKDHDTNIDGGDGEQTSGGVKVINDTKVEVTFGKAISEDLATEIEKSGERFVIYHGGQNANDSDVIKSTTINFNSDRTKAEVIFDEEPDVDVKYYVALMDGDDNEVSKVEQKFGPVVIKKGADKPSVDVNADQDKIVLDFKTKMDDSALENGNFEIFENDKSLGKLSDFVEAGEWVDGTSKKAVEFKLKKDVKPGLLAGKTYKIKASDDVETDDGKALSSSQKTITFKTPTVAKAQPEAKVARVNGAGEISIIFDKDLSEDMNFNTAMFTVKKPGGQTVNVTGVTRDGDKGILLTVDGELDRDLTYTIDVPAAGATNAYFANAGNTAKNGLKAQAQKDIEIKSMKAEFVQQVDNKDKADLLLTFDQRPDVESIKNIVVKEGSDKDEISVDAELYHGDTSGKTVIIKDVESQFENVALKSTKEYTIEIKAGGVAVDSGVNSPKTNQEKLKATAKGVSVTEPVVDTVRLISADEIEIEFKEDIDATNLKASDVKVAGYELYSNGKFSDKIMLQGDSQIKVNASGKKLIVKSANKNVKLVTSFDALDLEIAEDKFMNKDSKVENQEIKISGGDFDSDVDKVDRAKPVIVGVTKVNAQAVDVTYTEAVEFKDSGDDAKKASQFSVAKASKNAYGTEASVSGNVISITFNEKDTFKDDLDLSKVEVKYSKNSNVLVKDTAAGNEADNETVKGIATDANTTGGNDKEVNKTDLNKAIKDAEAIDTTAKTPESVKELTKAIEDAKKVAEDKDATEKQVKDAEKAIKDAIAKLKDKEDTGAEKTVKAQEIFETVEAKYSIQPAVGIKLTGLKDEYKGKELSFSLENEEIVRVSERNGVYAVILNTSKTPLKDIEKNLEVTVK